MRSYVFPALLAASLVPFALTPRNRRPVAPAAEVARVRSHFDSVLRELSATDLERLSTEQRLRRGKLLQTLRDYMDRGAFPKNYDFPGRQVPYFVDRKTGVRCAVAHLLESTGRPDIVARVSARNNNVRVPQLAADTAFRGWLDASGLTLAEATRIQPSYAEDRARTRHQYVVGSAFALGASVGTSIVNATANDDGHSASVSILGTVVGVATLGLGMGGLISSDRESTSRGIATADLIAGTTALVIGVRSLMHHHRDVAASRPAPAWSPRRATASVTPTVAIGSSLTAGMSVRLRF